MVPIIISIMIIILWHLEFFFRNAASASLVLLADLFLPPAKLGGHVTQPKVGRQQQ